MGTRDFVRALAIAALACAGAADALAVVVSGRVLGESGAPVANVNLDFLDPAGTSIPLVGDTTDPLGYYAVDVPPGTYDIYYKAPVGSGWAHRNVPGVVITGNTTRPDVRLPYGHAVSGFVTDSLGVPVFDVDLDFDDCATGERWLTLSDNTDVTGFYSIIVPAGTWDINYDPPAGDRHAAVVVPCVVITGPTTRPTVVLEDAFRVSARVVDTGGAPVVGANTIWFDAAGLEVRTNDDSTDATGTFTVMLAAGTYELEVRPPTGSPLVGRRLLDIVVAADRILPDIVLAPGLRVDGRVVDRAGQPIASVDTDWNLGASTVITGQDNTDAAGRYSVSVPAGVYEVDFDPAPGSRFVAARATGISITAPMTLPDTVLDAAWFVTGRVIDSGGAPAFDVNLKAVDSVSGMQVRTVRDHTDAAGEYLLALPDGTFDVTYEPPAGSGLAAVTVRGVVVSGADLRLSDVVLPRGFRIDGRVIDGSGQPVAGVDVQVFDSSTGDTVPVSRHVTDAAGLYAVVLPAGTFDLRYVPPAPFGTVTVAGVVVTADATRPDVVVSRAFVLSGHVVDSGGAPVAGAVVAASDPATGTPLALDAITDGAGAFSLAVREGDVDLVTTPTADAGLTSDSRTVALSADLDVGTIVLDALLVSLTPGSGGSGGGDALNLVGRDFVGGMTATLGGMPAVVVVMTPTTAVLTTGPHPAGVVDLVVAWPDGRVATLPAAFEYVAPAVEAAIRVVKDAGDVLITWTEAPGTTRTVFGSPRPDVFDAASILGTTTGLSHRDVGEVASPGTLYYVVQ